MTVKGCLRRKLFNFNQNFGLWARPSFLIKHFYERVRVPADDLFDSIFCTFADDRNLYELWNQYFVNHDKHKHSYNTVKRLDIMMVCLLRLIWAIVSGYDRFIQRWPARYSKGHNPERFLFRYSKRFNSDRLLSWRLLFRKS